MNVNKLNRYCIALSLFLGYTLFALSWKAGDLFITNSGYDANELSSLIAALNLVKVAVNVGAGVLTAKFVAERTFLSNSTMFMLGCLMVGGAMFALPMINDFYFIAVTRALLGFGGAFILFTMNPLVADTFPENELPIVNGLNASAFNIGIALMLSLAAVMAANPTMVTTVIAVVCVSIAVLFFLSNRHSVRFMKEKLKKSEQNTQHNASNDEEPYGIMDGFKSAFNWIFALTFTGIMSFYYVAFTFLDGGTVMYLMYAGIVGNLVGIAAAKTLKHIVVARLCSVLCLVFGIAFMFTLGTSLSPFIAATLGFIMMFSLPSYVTLGFTQPNASPKKIGITFMMFWVLSDLLATFILKIYAALASNPSTASTATVFILAIASCYAIGCFLLKGNKEAAVLITEQEAAA